MLNRLSLAVLGSGILGTALVASFYSPQNGFLIVFFGLMMITHVFGHGSHGGGHSHGNHDEGA